MAHIKRKYIDEHWLVFIIRGALALLFGGLALFNSSTDAPYLISLTGTFILAMGIIECCNALYNTRAKRGWLASIIAAIIDVAFALTILITMQSDVVVNQVLIAIYILLDGILEIILGFTSTVDPTDRFIRVVNGVCGAIMGFVIFNLGSFDFADFLRFFGVYVVIVGFANLIYGVHNHSQKKEDLAARKEAAAKAAKTRKAAKKSTSKK